MKKILSVLSTLLLFVFFAVILALITQVSATDIVTDTSANISAETDSSTNSSDNANEIVEETTNRITTILGISGTVGIGAIIIAVVAFFLKHLTSIKNIITSLANVFTSIFGKDGKVENVPQAFQSINNDIIALNKEFNKELALIQNELEKEKESNEQFKHILSVFIINSNYINPYAKNELIQLICGEKGFGMTVKDTILNIEDAVTRAKESEEKPSTPYLDKITSDVEGE